MKRTVVMLTLALAVEIALGLIGSQVLNAQQMSIKRTVLLKTDLPGIEGKEFLVDQVELAPGVAGGKHYHPGNVFVYILEGSGLLEIEGKPAVTQKAGSIFHEPPKQVQDFKNASKTEPVKLLVMFISEKGQPLSVPVE
jgi:quercetin dioxygenase-like cupin family protein